LGVTLPGMHVPCTHVPGTFVAVVQDVPSITVVVPQTPPVQVAA
jgi:hypothetical protein